MNDVYVIIEGTGREGPIAVGSYLVDAVRRLGIQLDCDCLEEEPTAQCAIKVVSGDELLSAPTSFETEHMSAVDRKDRQRLACQAKLEKSGEIVLMTVKKEKETEANAEENKSAESFKEEFKDLPLSEKFSSLVELEMMALGDTIAYVINSPYEAAGKVMDVMAGFGFDKEKKDQEAKVPEEHTETESKGEESEKKAEKPKSAKSTTTKAKPVRKRRPAKKKKE